MINGRYLLLAFHLSFSNAYFIKKWISSNFRYSLRYQKNMWHEVILSWKSSCADSVLEITDWQQKILNPDFFKLYQRKETLPQEGVLDLLFFWHPCHLLIFHRNHDNIFIQRTFYVLSMQLGDAFHINGIFLS